MQIDSSSKNVSSFRKALMVPFLLCILTFIPSVKNSYEWFELKTIDMFFTYYPIICKLTGQKQPINSPTVIITKDQSFQEKFGRSPNRKDLADLTNRLRNQGVKVAAYDYIFDEPTKKEEDNEFINELEKFPYTVLARNFIGRGQQNFSYIDIRDANADRPTGIVSLYKPISDMAIARGLINVPSDLDSIVRYAPLAYHLDGTDRFQPTFGFVTWLITLLSNQEEVINKIDISSATSLLEAYSIISKAAPYTFNSFNHSGLDLATVNVEKSFILKYIIKKLPKFKNDYMYVYREINSYDDKFEKTWLKLPSSPIPLIGSYNIPCIRLPYQKLPYPLKGDGIESISMTRLMSTEKEDNSVFMFSKNQFYVSAEEPYQQIKPSVPTCKSGENTLEGQIETMLGAPVASATVWAIMTKTGYWNRTYSDSSGKYILNNMPSGDYIIIVFVDTLNGYDKAMISLKITEKEQKAPLLMFADNSNCVEVDSSVFDKLIIQPDYFWVYGEIIPMIHSNKDGKVGMISLPEGFSLFSLNDNSDDEENYTFDGKGNLLLNGELCKYGLAAVLPNETDGEKTWKLEFCRKIEAVNQKRLIVDNLPSSLGAIINLTSRVSTLTDKRDQEINIKPGTITNLKQVPRVFQDFKMNINLNLLFSDEASENSKIILLSDSGEEYSIENGSSLTLPNGNYFVLTQSGNARGLHKRDTINKKTVFLGTSLATDQDFVVTPINFLDRGFVRMPGVHVHANLFAALYAGNFFYVPPFHMDRSPNAWPFYQFLLILPIFFLLNIKFKNANSLKSSLMLIFLILLLFGVAVYLFPSRVIIPIYYPSMLILSFGITRGFIEWINFRRLANQTQNAFSRFISKEIVKQIVNNPNAIKPGGEKKELTIMFTDIAGFTSISERLDAEALTELMNNYLDEMTKILFNNGGTLDKYVGDAIMGFWNHPTLQDNHATRAVTCAIEMQKKLKEMREKWMAQGLPKVEMRAGINTGNCMVGFIGSKIQMNFTCLGDNVNLASRLEGANKAYGTFIMISEPVKKQLNPYLFSIRFLDFLAVKGKNEPVLVYEVRGWVSEESEIWKEIAGNIYQKGIDKYLAREWDNAISLFKEVLKLVPEDAPSKVYIERCEHFKQQPPEANWDGRFVLKTK